jgi:Tfp pilus assembly ATPase PilU
MRWCSRAGRGGLPDDQPGRTDPRRTRPAAGTQGHRDDLRGLVIFVGGTGTGKTTSLAALVDHRNRNSQGHIITIEDPIEFVHEHKKCIVTQREIGVDTDTWEIALKNTLRQAPNVIMMGEIRDRATMDYAIAFAETGHLCLATLHANSTNQAIDRIINFFPEERRHQLLMDLSLNLRALVSQRLLPKKDGKGRVPAIEIMLNSPLISDLIFKGQVQEIKDVMKRSRELGMQTFDQALFDLYEAGQISYTDALRNADSLNDLRLQIKLHGKESKDRDLTAGIGHLAIVRKPGDRRIPAAFRRQQPVLRLTATPAGIAAAVAAGDHPEFIEAALERAVEQRRLPCSVSGAPVSAGACRR